MHAWSVLVAILASVCTAVAVINAAFGYTFNFAGIAVFVFAIHITSALSAVLGFLVALNNEYFTFDLAKLVPIINSHFNDELELHIYGDDFFA